MRLGQKALVRRDDGFPVRLKVENKSVAVVSAYPDAVYQTLVKRMDCDSVLALDEIVAYVNDVVIVAEMI